MINPAEGGDFHLAKTGDFGVAVDKAAGGGVDDDVTASIRPSGISRFQLVLEKESGVLGS